MELLVRNAWYVACWDYTLAETGMFATTIANEPIVIYRGETGRLIALEDRCCHRAAPLSLGRREGDDLRCMYHGLKFAPDGKCIEIPGQDRIPVHACVKSYAVAEKHSWVWVWLGNPAEADEALIPPATSLDDPSVMLKSGQIDYDANYLLINDNLLDFSHLTYVHANTFGNSAQWAQKRPTIINLDRGVRVQRWLKDELPPRASGDMQYERVDRWSSYDFLIPGILLMDSGVYPPGTADASNDGPPREDIAALQANRTCQAVTPLTDGTSRYLFSYGPTAATGDEALLNRMFETAKAAFGEDKAMIEAQQRTLAINPQVKMMPVSADAALSRFRWLMGRLMKAEMPEPAATVAAE